MADSGANDIKDELNGDIIQSVDEAVFEQLNNLDANKYFDEFNQNIISSLGYVIHGKYITNSSDINNPKIGDIRISFK